MPLCLILLFWKREKLSLIEKRRVEKIDMAEEAWIDDPVYVAVNKDAGESRSTLTWALRHLQFNKLFLLHVHLPISMNPTCNNSSF